MKKSKALWLGVFSIALGIGLCFVDRPELGSELVLGGLATIFLRHGTAKVEKRLDSLTEKPEKKGP